MVAAAYILLIVSKGTFKGWSQAVREQGCASALPLFVRHFRWQMLCFVLAFGISVAFVVGFTKLFIGVQSDARGITLEYNWPRSNIHLNWSDIKNVNIETHQFGSWRKNRQRLFVVVDKDIYISPWSGNDGTVQRANDLIQAPTPQ